MCWLLRYLVLALWLLSGTEVLAAEKIRLANGEWAPFLSANLPHYGYASHIVTEAFKREGIEVQYEFYPWARAQEMVKAGTIDGSLVWSTTVEREKFAWFSDIVMTDDEVLFHLAKRPLNWTRPEDLRGLSMSRPLGSKLGVWEQPIQSGVIHSEVTIDVRTGFLQLLAGRIDFFPLAKSVGLHLLREKFTPEVAARISYAPTVAEHTEYRLMLSRAMPRNEALIQRFNAGLLKLRRSGDLARMERDYYAGRYDR